ncbi:MAG: hypothetical protein ACMUIU_03505 [bacterium]
MGNRHLQVTVNTDIQPDVTDISNQAKVFGDDFTTVYSDDPDTSEENDPTETPPEPIFAIMLDMPKGWRMISLPLTPYNARLSWLFPDAAALYGYKKGLGYVIVRREDEL